MGRWVSSGCREPPPPPPPAPVAGPRKVGAVGAGMLQWRAVRLTLHSDPQTGALPLPNADARPRAGTGGHTEARARDTGCAAQSPASFDGNPFPAERHSVCGVCV
eukprot:CAMPEP_0174337800 /NCGR_PEP_ID=MMETSP0810-20121108/22612_1 /TAXON_ID=73025 ORGANISM="Eutreptiella gymnastica-like, Strain CCMP1594" /NCGR_SAMPLE_ID=MMETSP0810 /ASSEMBLY_ACC=CAM_ASM_000659 /LENGTH=104 /DNA_ID=CAMNT_0015457475 /DNA_START=833 /DNA_END=1144 /DNA_ORIENTATION=+